MLPAAPEKFGLRQFNAHAAPLGLHLSGKEAQVVRGGLANVVDPDMVIHVPSFLAEARRVQLALLERGTAKETDVSALGDDTALSRLREKLRTRLDASGVDLALSARSGRTVRHSRPWLQPVPGRLGARP